MTTGVARSWWFAPGIYGAVVSLVVQLVFVRYWNEIAGPGNRWADWWLESESTIRWMQYVLLVASLTAAVLWPRTPWRAALAMLGGAMVSMTLVLFAIGPGTVFPIVLAVCLRYVAPPIIVGTAIVEIPRTLWRWTHRLSA